MPKGLPSWALKEARARKARNPFAYAWSLVKKKGGKSGSKPSRSSNPKGGKKMGKGKKKRRGKRQMTIPILPIAGLAAGTVPPILGAISDGDWNEHMADLFANYSGYRWTDGSFDLGRLMYGTVPLVMGVVLHKVVGGWLGVNRALGNAKVPFIRL